MRAERVRWRLTQRGCLWRSWTSSSLQDGAHEHRGDHRLPTCGEGRKCVGLRGWRGREVCGSIITFGAIAPRSRSIGESLLVSLVAANDPEAAAFAPRPFSLPETFSSSMASSLSESAAIAMTAAAAARPSNPPELVSGDCEEGAPHHWIK